MCATKDDVKTKIDSLTSAVERLGDLLEELIKKADIRDE